MDCDCTLDPKHTLNLLGLKKKKYLKWCAQCGKAENEGIVLRRCGRCRIAGYCNEECQAKNWSSHKPLCIKDKSAPLANLCRNLGACSNILHYLAVCAALAHGLDKDDTANAVGPDRTLRVHVYMTIAPYDMHDVERLLLLGPDHFVNARVEGVLQFTKVVPVKAAPEDLRHGEHLAQTRFWKTLSMFLDPKDWAMVVIFLENGTTTVTMHLPYFLGSLKDELKEKNFAHIDTKSTFKTNIAKSLKHLNDHIRADKDNDYNLRCAMRNSDKVPILEAPLRELFSGWMESWS